MDAQRSGVPFHGPVISEDFGLSGYVLRTDPVPSISAYSLMLQGSRTWVGLFRPVPMQSSRKAPREPNTP